MIALYSYPELFGVADNNGHGLKVGQLPYIIDADEAIGDSDTIIAHLIRKYRLKIDDGLTAAQRDTSHLIARMLDDLYWVMSYSRWKDVRYWPSFRDALLRQHPSLTEAGLRKAQEFNSRATISKASAATLRPLPMRAGSRICRCWRTSSRRTTTCMGRNRPASMLLSTASSPIFIFFTRSIPRSSNSSRRTPISSGIALKSTPPSVQHPQCEHSNSRLEVCSGSCIMSIGGPHARCATVREVKVGPSSCRSNWPYADGSCRRRPCLKVSARPFASPPSGDNCGRTGGAGMPKTPPLPEHQRRLRSPSESRFGPNGAYAGAALG
jgi:hypothetical protein